MWGGHGAHPGHGPSGPAGSCAGAAATGQPRAERVPLGPSPPLTGPLGGRGGAPPSEQNTDESSRGDAESPGSPKTRVPCTPHACTACRAGTMQVPQTLHTHQAHTMHMPCTHHEHTACHAHAMQVPCRCHAHCTCTEHTPHTTHSSCIHHAHTTHMPYTRHAHAMHVLPSYLDVEPPAVGAQAVALVAGGAELGVQHAQGLQPQRGALWGQSRGGTACSETPRRAAPMQGSPRGCPHAVPSSACWSCAWGPRAALGSGQTLLPKKQILLPKKQTLLPKKLTPLPTEQTPLPATQTPLPTMWRGGEGSRGRQHPFAVQTWAPGAPSPGVSASTVLGMFGGGPAPAAPGIAAPGVLCPPPCFPAPRGTAMSRHWGGCREPHQCPQPRSVIGGQLCVCDLCPPPPHACVRCVQRAGLLLCPW